MKNEIGRKITSLTLMTIMLAGGMTIAFPGFTPDAYAVNANLIVSAENTGGDVDGAQVIEIVIIDEDISASPDITVNGDAVSMTAAGDGNWYAYIADDSQVQTVHALAGISFGVRDETPTNPDATASYAGDADNPQNVVKAAKSLTNGNSWIFIQTYIFPGTIEIEYNKAGGTQTSTLTFDDADSPGLSLDRSTYPAGAQVHVTIEDNRLNIDPTSDDIWAWNTADQTMYYMVDAANNARDLTATDADPTQWVATNACGDCVLLIEPNRQNDKLLEDAILVLDTGLGDLPIRDTVEEVIGVPEDDTTADITELVEAVAPEMWFIVAEDGGPNTAIFTATDLDDNSILRTADDAQRGSAATIDYDDTITGIQVQFSEATIDIQSPDDVWTSGQAIPIVLVDGDVNKNSLSGDDLSLTDANSIIPTLVTGDPFTLGEIKSDLTTWVGWNGIASPTLTGILANLNLESPAPGHYYNGTDADSFIVKGIGLDADDQWVDLDDGAANAVIIKQSAEVESFSERAILSYAVDIPERTQSALAALNILTGTTSTANELVGLDFIVIDLDDEANDDDNAIVDLRASLINTNNTSFHGFNMINYNVGELGATPDNLEILVGGTPIATITLGDTSGYEPIDDATLELLFGIEGDEYVTPADGFTQLKLNFAAGELNIADGHVAPIVIDFFSFGFENNGQASDERIANQIIRLELEESDSDTGSLEGTLEYVMINQLNIDNADTYTGLTTVSDAVSFIVIEDLTGSSAPSVTYLDVDTTGTQTQVSAQEDAPSHSAVVSLSVDSFKAADTVTVTLEDLDLNVDSDLVDIYTVVDVVGDANYDAVGEPYGDVEPGLELGRLLDITFDDQRWMTQTDEEGRICTPLLLNDNTGLGDTIFSLTETGSATGIFVGTFPIPAEFCREGSEEPESVTGLDIEVNYVDFRDASGETTEVGDSAGIKANTGSVSFDRTVYPVPFGVVSDFDKSSSTTPAQSNTNTRSIFPIHQNGMDDDTGLQSGEFLPQGDLIVYVTITDPDFDVSASGRDSIALDDAPVTVSVIRGSQDVTVAKIGDASNPIDEIAPGAGIFEASVTLHYYDGPESSICPSTSLDEKTPDKDLNGRYVDGEWVTSIEDDEDYCILQGDILQVEYLDPTDASGQSNSVTDSATFDLRNGVLQSDKSVYIIGSDMILTLIEPDFDLDSSQNETYDLDLIKWSSSAATVTMGDADGEIGAFDPEPLSFRETGPSTGIFQIVVEIPQILDGSSLQRGEEIDLEYTDWGPSGSDYVGDEDEDIRLTVFTSNFGATIDLDQKVYSWTDKVYITVVAPDHNFDNNLIDEIGETDEDPLRVATKGYDLDNYRLVETGFDTGIFTGEVILTGFAHDPTGDGNGVVPRTTGSGPTDGYLQTPSDGGISVSYEFSEDETVFTSSIIRWNIGDVQWLEASYPASGTGVLRVIDPDMNLNPEAVDNFDVNIASDTDASGITLTITETNEATGIFEGTVFFTTTGGSSGHRLRVSEGDTVTADYADGTLPLPYTTNDNVSITSTTIIGTIVPPLERAPATNLRIVNAFGSDISVVSVDQQVQITADLSSGQDKDQDFAYLIQIQDGEGVTVSLSWIAGSLSPGKQFSPSGSWTPTDAGTYTVTVFVWESIDNPTALSPPLTIDVSVN